MFFHQPSSAEPALDLFVIVGLGNIGSQYTHTRHNIGFEVADELARRRQAHFRVGKFKGEETTIHLDGRRVLLLKPHTLMNLSGESVVAATRFYKIPPTRVLVICDDVHLPVGKLRLRAKGSDGGHNGLWSIIHRLGTADFARIRIGVGETPPGFPRENYVLSRFTSDERPLMRDATENAASATETWVRDGMETAMNRWNGS